jgi:superfamily II DNA or RNA helicase
MNTASGPDESGQSPRRRPSRALREWLFLRSNGVCEREGCDTKIDIDTFQVAHLLAHASGGAVVEDNLEAWCPRCNAVNGARDVADTRVLPRDWQIDALPITLERIARSGVATIAAAPASGKTLFASFVFEYLRAAGFVDRMVVLTPRVTLVKQWHSALLEHRQIDLRPGAEVEREGEVGVIQTYQSLNLDTVRVHRQLANRSRTLLVLDEVHHVGEAPDGERPAWARHVSDLAGTVDEELRVAAILNLSGTLWRSRPHERISTVRYIADSDLIVSDVDYRVEAADLIRAGVLRGVDLFRRSSRVELVNYAKGRQVEGQIADLDEEPGRAVLREIAKEDEWREGFIDAILDRLEVAHRSLGKGPAKALIVARSQEDARAFAAMARDRLSARGVNGIATSLAISNEANAHAILERFRRSDRVGVLCTVDMAGEGYDCPEISVIGFASNKLTALYVRQVVARAQRVTDYERHVIGRPIAAAVVIPDVQELVDRMSELLEPMRHELAAEQPGALLERSEVEGSTRKVSFPEWLLVAADDHRDGDVRVLREDGARDVDADLVAVIAMRLRASGRLRETDAPLIASILRETTELLPYDTATAVADVEAPVQVRVLSVDERAKILRGRMKKLRGWWANLGDPTVPVANFVAQIHSELGIPKGGLENANIDQLEKVLHLMSARIREYCDRTGARPPKIERDTDEANG